MNEPIWTPTEAAARARELLQSFDRDPDVLSPDEQALAMVIKALVARYSASTFLFASSLN